MEWRARGSPWWTFTPCRGGFESGRQTSGASRNFTFRRSSPGGSKHHPPMVDPIGDQCVRNPTVRSYGSRVPRSRGARGSTRWTRWTSFLGHARSANGTSAARRGARQARTLPAKRTPAGRLTRYAVGFVRVLLSPGVAAAVSQLPQVPYPLAPGSRTACYLPRNRPGAELLPRLARVRSASTNGDQLSSIALARG